MKDEDDDELPPEKKEAKLPGQPVASELGYYDILIGRGFQYEGHPGNMIFYATIDAASDEYFAVSTKKEKTSVVKRIYRQLIQKGRFVKYDAQNDTYLEIDEKEARQKVSHALRYRRSNEPSVPAPAPAPAAIPVPAQSSSANPMAAPAPVHVDSAYDLRAHLATSSEKRRSEDHAGTAPADETLSAPCSKVARLGDNESSSDSALFSDANLEGAIGKPGELDITMLHHLEDFSVFGGSFNETAHEWSVSTRQLKPAPKVPDAVVLNGLNDDAPDALIQDPNQMAASDFADDAATGNLGAAAIVGQENSDVFPREQLLHDMATNLPRHESDGRSDSFGGFNSLEGSSPEISVSQAPAEGT